MNHAFMMDATRTGWISLYQLRQGRWVCVAAGSLQALEAARRLLSL